MSLMTALLAFLPALAAKKAEPELDLEIELLQAREGRARAETLLADARYQMVALETEIFALRREREAVDHRRMAAYLNQGMQCVNQQSQQLAAQLNYQAQQLGALGLAPREEIDGRPCTCVPGHADALIGAYRRF